MLSMQPMLKWALAYMVQRLQAATGFTFVAGKAKKAIFRANDILLKKQSALWLFYVGRGLMRT
nr:MAG TPA: hypothetical protein [Caudoviricetes sp.]